MSTYEFDLVHSDSPRLTANETPMSRELSDLCRKQQIRRKEFTGRINEDGRFYIEWLEINELRSQINKGFENAREQERDHARVAFDTAIDELQKAIREMTVAELLTSKNSLLRTIGAKIQSESEILCRGQNGFMSEKSLIGSSNSIED